MANYSTNMPITTWAEADRPREKLLAKGKRTLSDAELIAILIGSGTRKETAVELSRRILNTVNDNLNELGRLTVKDLTQFKGIGEAKAIAIVAALELGGRRQSTKVLEREKITGSRDAYGVVRHELADLPHEEFWVMYLDRSNKVIKHGHISQGGVSGTVADMKIIFKQALELLASSIILFHNHPSGNLKPSQADVKLTRKVKNAGELLEIAVLDHLIVTGSGYYSFADEGML